MRPNPYIEGGVNSITSLTWKLKWEIAQTGIQHFYGWVCRPMGKRGPLYAQLTPEQQMAWVRSQTTTSVSFMPQKKGCYGWVWEHVKAAVKRADEQNHTDHFRQINKTHVTNYPLSLAKALQKQGWKVIYFAADWRRVSQQERDQVARNTYSPEQQIPIDIKMVNFAPRARGSAANDTNLLQKLKTIGFYWGIVANGSHSFVGLAGKASEFDWAKCPNQFPIKEPSVDKFFSNWNSGIILVPPDVLL
jgi:hypothetical protein